MLTVAVEVTRIINFQLTEIRTHECAEAGERIPFSFFFFCDIYLYRIYTALARPLACARDDLNSLTAEARAEAA